MGPNITAELADDALKMVLARRNPPDGCVNRSDRGSRRVSPPHSKTVRERGIRPSMGSISSPWDNAAMESPMGIVESECVHAQAYATREEAALDLFEYIEVVYNRARMHSALGHLSPAPSSKGPIGPRKKAAPRRRKGCQRKLGRFRPPDIECLQQVVDVGVRELAAADALLSVKSNSRARSAFL